MWWNAGPTAWSVACALILATESAGLEKLYLVLFLLTQAVKRHCLHILEIQSQSLLLAVLAMFTLHMSTSWLNG